MLKILQVRLQQFVNRELPDVQAGLRKGRGTRDPTANIHWITEKARQFQENINFCPWVSVEACCRAGGTEGSSAWMGPSEGGCHCLHYLHHSLASGKEEEWQPTPVLLPGKSHGWSLVGYSPWGCKESDTTERLHFLPSLIYLRASLVAQTVKRLPAMRETQVRSLGWDVPLEKEMATHSSILAWKIPWMEPGRLQSMGSQRVGHDWATSLHFTSLSNESKECLEVVKTSPDLLP